MKVVRCRRRAGVGQEAADGLWMCELPMQLLPPLLDPIPPTPSDELLSDLSFLNAPEMLERERNEPLFERRCWPLETAHLHRPFIITTTGNPLLGGT